MEKSTGRNVQKTVLRLNLKNVEKVFENPEQLRAYEEASEFEFNKTDSKTLPAAPVVKNIYTEQVKQIEANPVETTTSEILPAGPGPKEENQTEEFFCESCGKKISWAENSYSNKHFSKPLCRTCQAITKGDK